MDITQKENTENFINTQLDLFEKCSKRDECNQKYWYARDLQKLLGYTKWENFLNTLEKAKISYINFGMCVNEHFLEVFPDARKNSLGGRPSKDYKLTRYACYLIAQNGNPQKKEIVFSQTYFAIQTHSFCLR